MKGKNKIQWYSIILLAFCLSSCEVKRPDIVLSDAEMESVLYDFHIAKAMGEDVPYEDNYKRVLYVEYVYKKHGITQAVFDSSMVWFTRNPEALTEIYDKINVRLKAQRDNLNHLIALRSNKPKESAPGDSIDVWAWQRIRQLTGMPLDNKITFTIPSDSNFKDRDTLRWIANFRFPGGKPDTTYAPLMAMQVFYDKGIRNSVMKIKKAGTKTLSLTADTLGKIKEIRGFIYYPTQKSAQYLLIDHLALMRYHANDSLVNAKSDTIKAADVDSLKEKKPLQDSIIKEDSPRREGPRPRPSLRQQENIKLKQD